MFVVLYRHAGHQILMLAIFSGWCVATILCCGMRGSILHMSIYGGQCLQDALLQMKPGAAVRFQTELPFLGHDPTGKVPRCPVEIQVKAATKQPGTPGTPAIFTPTLASQRHALALQVLYSPPSVGLH